ncbi:hypothetical protein FQN54_004700 [Arachnomyces sp. PD_36]|nr:hypothetical protein FQN54_004700 [Arachnomyces sp. PD_36]
MLFSKVVLMAAATSAAAVALPSKISSVEKRQSTECYAVLYALDNLYAATEAARPTWEYNIQEGAMELYDMYNDIYANVGVYCERLDKIAAWMAEHTDTIVQNEDGQPLTQYIPGQA